MGSTRALQCRPARALVASGASVLTRVELVETTLCISTTASTAICRAQMDRAAFPNAPRAWWHATDPCGSFRFVWPDLRQHRQHAGATLAPGGRCSGQVVGGGHAGSYSNALRTGFNGFGEGMSVLLHDAPWYLDAVERAVGCSGCAARGLTQPRYDSHYSAGVVSAAAVGTAEVPCAGRRPCSRAATGRRRRASG